jgi:hypothetical protein
MSPPRTVAASSYDPYSDPPSDQIRGPINKPTAAIRYRPPVHVPVALTLTITPGPGEQPVSFPIALDAIR